MTWERKAIEVARQIPDGWEPNYLGIMKAWFGAFAVCLFLWWVVKHLRRRAKSPEEDAMVAIQSHR